MTRSTVWMSSAVLALSVLASPALAQTTSSGAGDGYAPGPLNTFHIDGVQEIAGVQYVLLAWNEPYNNTTAIDGSGTPVGTTLATSRKTYFSTVGPFTSSTSFVVGGAIGATPCGGEAAIAPPAGGTRNWAFPVPAGGMTYYFGQEYKDVVNTSYTVGANCPSIFVPAAMGGAGTGSGGGGGGGGCVASPVSWFSTFASAALGKLSEGASLVVLAGCLVLVGIALRRPA